MPKLIKAMKGGKAAYKLVGTVYSETPLGEKNFDVIILQSSWSG